MREIAIGVACAAAIGAVACQVQGNCETTPAFVDYCTGSPNDVVPCQGHIIDATHWESGPQNGNFLTFGASQNFHMHFRDAQTGQVLSGSIVEPPFVEVSATAQGNAPGSSWIECGVGLCNFNIDPDQSSLWVQNGSCAAYFFHVTVTVVPSTSADAGTD